MDAGLVDEDLMLRYRDGDAGAFEILYQRHRGPLYRYFLRQCGDAGISEELYQDVWMKIIHSRHRYEPKAKFTTFLYRVAHNRLIDHYRKNGRVQFGGDEAPEPDELAAPAYTMPSAQVEVAQQAEYLLEILDGLPPDQREAFLLREEAGLSLHEIAEATGVKPETAKSRLRYAVAKIRSSFKEWQ